MLGEILAQSGSDGLSALIPPLLTGAFGLLGTLIGVLYQRRSEYNRQANDNLYRPLLSELKGVSKGELAWDSDTRRFHSYWQNLDWYWKTKMDDELSTDLDNYSSDVDALNQSLEKIAEEIISSRSRLGDLWDGTSGHGESEYIENKLLMRQNQAGSRRTFKPLIYWLAEYSDAFFKSTDIDELRTELEDIADTKSPEHRRAIDEWSDQDLVVLGEAIQETNENILFPDDCTSVFELRERIENEAERLTRELDDASPYLI